MPTKTERKALVFLGAVACLGGGVRLVRAHEIAPPVAARRALDAQIVAVDSARHSTASRSPRVAHAHRDTNPPVSRGTMRPAPKRPVSAARRVPAEPSVTPFNRLDVDQASATELQRLPGIGPALAARIVAYRDSNGPFGNLEALGRVKGIGPATMARLDSLVRFSGIRRR